jgi:hypothetical protein
MSIKAERRGFRVQLETGYKINNISLVKSYIVPKKVEVEKVLRKGFSSKKTTETFEVNLSINGVQISPSYEDEKYYYFDFHMIREMLRDVIPTNEEENEMVRLENMLAYNGLCAQNAYKNLLKEGGKKIFTDTIFTNQDLEVKLLTKCKNKFFELEEEYYTSDVHKNN